MLFDAWDVRFGVLLLPLFGVCVCDWLVESTALMIGIMRLGVAADGLVARRLNINKAAVRVYGVVGVLCILL